MIAVRNLMKYILLQNSRKADRVHPIPKTLNNGSGMINSNQISKNIAHMHTSLMDHFRIIFYVL